ncbi:VanZ family protein [Bacillus alkalicellulosilyticus]|uniref:VanZ family protein n=1 Tax=Alkalihalobacterium alkalicellulosilyticum TaxID=1912214 RepID=UPI0009974A67|nr:VanZ family protein [Bacillus alkalicellulosilyticus]
MEESMSIMFSIESWYVLVPMFIGGVILLMKWRKEKESPISFQQYVVVISFGIYLLSVIHLVFFPIDVNIGDYANQTPWYKTINFIPVLTIDVFTFLLNILMLVPFGMYIPFLKSSVTSVKTVAKYGFMLSLSFEVLQMVIRITLGSGRSSDINDLLANTAGAVIGFLIIKAMLSYRPLKRMFIQFQL